ncbi:MAG: hypothetical protein QOG26_989 [Solirubrobacterales bacterium]|nr:hypothetical protein [Solirubrobacterales bacterium]
MRALRNIAIIAALAAVVDLVPGGGNGATTVLTALMIGFFWALGFSAHRLYLENQMTLATLSETRRAVLFGAIGLIVLLIAGSSKLFATPRGTFVWVLLLAVATFAIVRIWIEAKSYG